MTHEPSTPDDGPGIRDDEFEAVRDALYRLTGIALNDTKRQMVCSRLARRLRHHGIGSVGEYLRLAAGDPAERQEFVNCLTTNKTDFFREAHHFDFLRDTVIPRAARTKRLRVWCSASSTGEEPYTLAMTLAEHCPAAAGWDVKILASDIDTAVLAHAQKGVYDADRAGDIPPDLLHKFFLRGTGANAGKVAARPDLKNLLAFRQINLIADDWPIRTRFDVIFCRNVVIYFDRPTQQKLLERFAALLNPDGFLFMGHSENLHWMSDVYAPVGGTVYRLRDAGPLPAETPPPAVTPPPARKPLKLRAAPAPKPAPTATTPTAPGDEHTIILGDVKVAEGPAVLKTLLGSCVSACIYDPVTGIGGMNHFSLPGVSDEGTSARYGAYAMEMLVTGIMKQGGDRNRLRAKVFGGGKVLKVDSEHLNVGAKNAAFVLSYLSDEGIPVDGQCLGGTTGLLVRFQPNTGRALAKPLGGQHLSGIVRDEEAFGRDLLRKVQSPGTGAVTMF